jgi:hypothetical protein
MASRPDGLAKADGGGERFRIAALRLVFGEEYGQKNQHSLEARL